jgi:hypothetical protein
MKKLLYTLALASLALSAGMRATIASNQTYIRIRDAINNNAILAMSGNARGTDMTQSRIGCTISAAPYYRSSHNTAALAQNFGGGQAVNNTQYGKIVVEPGESISFEDEAYNLHSQLIDHTAANRSATSAESTRGISGSVSLNPSRTETGVHLSVTQKADFLFKGLSFSLDMPIIEIEQSLNPIFSGFAHSADASGETGSTLAQYFNGKRFVKATTAAQEELKYAKISRGEHSVTGVSDIKLSANYPLFSNETYRFMSAATMTIPTSKKTTGKFLFQPRLGSGHVRIGAQATLTAHLIKHKHNNYGLHAFGNVHYQYAFKAEHTRTLGLYNHWYNILATSGHYRNLGLNDAEVAVPAANVLTRTVIVKPGQIIDGIMGMRFHYNNISASLMYNLHAHEAEKVELAPAARWFDDEYGMLSRGSDVSAGITVGNNNSTYGGAIQQEGSTAAIAGAGGNNAAQYYITTQPCTGRSDVTHKVAGALEWHYKKLRFPISISAGGEYEFPHTTHSNSGIHSWACWSKLSVCF